MDIRTCSDKPPRRRNRRLLLLGAFLTVTMLGGATAWGLDRYVIEHVEVDQASSLSPPHASVASPASSGTWTATSYRSDTATISIETLERGEGENLVRYFVADVTLTHATILRSAFANDSFGRNITANTSDIAADAGAVLAINGDYCGFRDDGIVIRNGVAYRDRGTRQGLALYSDGSASIYDETTTTADQLLDAGVWQTLSFGPPLLHDGQIPDGIDTYEIGDFGPVLPGALGSIQGNQPRTGIGVVQPNHLVLVVAAGRGANGSRGVSMSEFAQIFQEAGATTAYNLDGGGSATMVFNGQLVNEPAWRNGQQRGTSDIIFVAG